MRMKRSQQRLPHTAKSKQISFGAVQALSADVISLRPRSENSEAREQNKPSPEVDTTLDLPLQEICRAWSKVTKDHSDLLMNWIFAGYWQCAFESGGQSPIFQWVTENHCLNSVSGNVSYARTPAGNITALKEKLRWPRGDLFLFLVALEKSECSGPLASRPSRTCKPTEDELRAMAGRPIRTYPRDFVSIWLPELYMGRDDFGRRYTGSSLSAGAPLDSFWLGPTSAVTTRVELDLNSEPKRPDQAVDAAQLLHSPKTDTRKPRTRGPRGKKIAAAIEVMKGIDPNRLDGMLEKELVEEVGSKPSARLLVTRAGGYGPNATISDK
jgi:hypothetical protein